MMTSVEEYNLQRCEAVIEKNMRAFVEVGLALLEIRESRWYKASGYSSFETYCRNRWGMSRNYADKTIQASQYALSNAKVSTTVLTLPNETPEQSSPMAAPELPNEWQVRKAIQADRNQATETESFVATPINRNAMRCEAIMRELTENPDLARLVRIELMKWYALNT